MRSHSEISQRLQINLQDYPEIAARFEAGDPTVAAMLKAHASFMADLSSDLDIAMLEPFIKSRDTTILADATNKGILPVATPCQHYLSFKNKGDRAVTISAGRLIEDMQGRIWRLLQTANMVPGEIIEVLAEQSQNRTEKYKAIFTEPFHHVTLNIQEDYYLAALRIYDEQGNNFIYRRQWMNSIAGEAAYTLKTDSMQRITAEFGDSLRCGTTIQANAVLNFELTETDGYIDTSLLREAALSELITADEGKIQITFKEGGLVRAGANPLSIDQLKLLASYPTHDDNAVFLSDFNYAVRKAFMNRCHYISVWNEAQQEKYYGATLDDINHLNIAFVPRVPAEKAQLASDIKKHIAHLDSLYEGKVKEMAVQQRPFQITINAKLAPVHNVESVKQEINNLLLSKYGKETIASSYFVADGFNSQEISKVIRDEVTAFQDRISDFRLDIEDLARNPIKPHEWVFMTDSSISIYIQRSASSGEPLWTY